MPEREKFPAIFERLKTLFEPYVPPLIVQADTADNYYLTTLSSPKNPKGFFVGAVQVKKNYVSYHFMPVYIFPDLLEGISERLKKRMQGKSCFNFVALDEEMVKELGKLTVVGIQRAREEGYAGN